MSIEDHRQRQGEQFFGAAIYSRDVARDAFGEKYDEALKPYIAMVEKRMASSGLGPLSAAALLKAAAKDGGLHEGFQCLILAAAAELLVRAAYEIGRPPRLN